MRDSFPRALAVAFLDGPWIVSELVSRAADVLGMEPTWLPSLAARVVALFPTPPVDDDSSLVRALSTNRQLALDLANSKISPPVRRWSVTEPTMDSVTGAPATFEIPTVLNLAELATRLRVSEDELAWFADRKGMNAKTSIATLHHYRYLWVEKRHLGHRLIEAPKPRLKNIQRWILRRLLAHVPVSAHAHGFVRERNVQSFVAPHTGQSVVVRVDLRDFFASIHRSRIDAIFRRVGYPRAVASALTGLCTLRTPDSVLRRCPAYRTDLRFDALQKLRVAHLPQGAPTSPALANLVAWRLDQRLAGLARAYGATMTRYADDLAFSGDRPFSKRLPTFLAKVRAIAQNEGFQIHESKSRIMHEGHRQELCGLIVNERANLPRREFDTLRAVLFNCAKHGPDSQNHDRHPEFRRHLEGRISWVTSVHPQKGARLTTLFERIRWDDCNPSHS